MTVRSTGYELFVIVRISWMKYNKFHYPIFRHHQFLLNPPVGNLTNLEEWMEKYLDFYTVNGQLQPVLHFPLGQMKRFRYFCAIVHTAHRTT